MEDWLDAYENPMKPVVERVREVVLASDDRVDECIKWKAPTFTYRGNLASFEEVDAAAADIERIVKAWCDWRDGA